MSITCASEKRIRATFPRMTVDEVRLIRQLCAAADDEERLEALVRARCPETWSYVESCASWPLDSRTVVLHAVDVILGTDGVEHLGEVDMRDGPPVEYCNAGDPYAVTLVYYRDADALRVGCWADAAERLGL